MDKYFVLLMILVDFLSLEMVHLNDKQVRRWRTGYFLMQQLFFLDKQKAAVSFFFFFPSIDFTLQLFGAKSYCPEIFSNRCCISLEVFPNNWVCK